MSQKLTKKEDIVKYLVSIGYDEDDLAKASWSEIRSTYAEEFEKPTAGGAEDSEDESEEDDEDSSEPINIYNTRKRVGDDFVRTYSKKVHGKDYKKLAKQFLAKFPYMEAR